MNLRDIYIEGLRGKLNRYPTIEELMKDFKENQDDQERVLKFRATIGTHRIEEWWDAHTMKQYYEQYLLKKQL